MIFLEYCKLWLRVIRKKGWIYKDHTKPSNLGNKILLLGNGPSASLFNKHMDYFSDYDLLVVNLYPLKKAEFWTLKPRYLCILDPLCVNPMLCVEKGIKAANTEDCLALVDMIEKRVDWPLTIVSYASAVFPYKNPNISYIKLSNARLKWRNLKINKKMFFKNWAVPNAQGVIVCALYFAMIFGYREIALLGVEQSYLNTFEVGLDNRTYSAVKHCYETSRAYIPHTYEAELEAALEIFRGIGFAARMAEGEDIRIINYTINSYIQCFEKYDLESAGNQNESQ